MKRIRLAAAVLLLPLLLYSIPAAAAVDSPRSLTAAEEYLAARFCAEKAPGAPLIVYMGFCSVLLNRAAHPDYPDSVGTLVLSAGYAGAPVRDEDLELALWAVRCAQWGMDPTDGALRWARAGSPASAHLRTALEAEGWCFGR